MKHAGSHSPWAGPVILAWRGASLKLSKQMEKHSHVAQLTAWPRAPDRNTLPHTARTFLSFNWNSQLGFVSLPLQVINTWYLVHRMLYVIYCSQHQKECHAKDRHAKLYWNSRHILEFDIQLCAQIHLQRQMGGIDTDWANKPKHGTECTAADVYGTHNTDSGQQESHGDTIMSWDFQIFSWLLLPF